jgi:hypothetical protein
MMATITTVTALQYNRVANKLKMCPTLRGSCRLGDGNLPAQSHQTSSAIISPTLYQQKPRIVNLSPSLTKHHAGRTYGGRGSLVLCDINFSNNIGAFASYASHSIRYTFRKRAAHVRMP